MDARKRRRSRRAGGTRATNARIAPCRCCRSCSSSWQSRLATSALLDQGFSPRKRIPSTCSTPRSFVPWRDANERDGSHNQQSMRNRERQVLCALGHCSGRGCPTRRIERVRPGLLRTHLRCEILDSTHTQAFRTGSKLLFKQGPPDSAK